MKKRFTAIAAALLALTGCASNQSGNSSVTSDALGEGGMSVASNLSGGNSETALALAGEIESDTDIALEENQTQEETRKSPPQLQVMYSGDGLSACAAMTLGTYTWDDGEQIICADSAGPVACAVEGRIHAEVDLDVASENEPKINLYAGAEISSVRLYPLDGEDSFDLEYTADGIIKFPENVYDGVVAVLAAFPEGNADYFFTVKRSLTDPSTPPSLRVYSGNYFGFVMTKGAYDWTYTVDDTRATATTDIGSPWQLYSSGVVRPELSVLPGEKLTVMLPEGGEITSAKYWTSDDEGKPLTFSGREITMPSDNISAVCAVTVTMPSGKCDYLFSVNIGDSSDAASVPPEEP